MVEELLNHNANIRARDKVRYSEAAEHLYPLFGVFVSQDSAAVKQRPLSLSLDTAQRMSWSGSTWESLAT